LGAQDRVLAKPHCHLSAPTLWPMPTIILVRHGQASFGSDDYDQLSPTGEQQAEVTARALAAHGVRPSRILSGSLRRQIDTAARSASGYGLGTEIDPRWNEYSMDGIIAAHPDPQATPIRTDAPLTSAAYQDILETALTQWMTAGEDTTAPESWPAFRARVSDGLHELAGSLASGSTALVFSSGGVIAAVCAELLEMPARQVLLLNRVAINAGVTKLAVGRRGVTLISFNDHAHLEAPGLITLR
jgi:broad specificity phosphatase PhoE